VAMRSLYTVCEVKGRIMNGKKKCLRCGGINLQAGSVQSTGKIYFRPKSAKLAAVLTGGATVSASTCLDCGYVELAVDADKVKSLLKKP